MRHWRLESNDSRAWLTLDVEGRSANVLSHGVLAELEQALAQIAGQYVRGLVIRSGKDPGFSAGADVREFEKVADAEQAAELARLGQRVFARLAALPFPSVALIHGFCLGGGLELALACTYRVARDDPGTRLGLPEVRLGLHPGFAGTVRLPSLIGHLPALDLMLTGRTLDARAARRLGLVDEVVPERHLRAATLAFLRRHPPRAAAPWRRRPAGVRVLRPLVARLLRRRVAAKADPRHYPAPYRILDLWRHNAGADAEARSLGELLVSPQSRNLVRLFLLGEERKRAARAVPHGVEHVHVVGAGVMGADIAMWAAHRGFRVSLQDRHAETLARAVRRAHAFFVKQRREPRAVQEAMDRLMPDLKGAGLGRADLVIEAIVEDVEVKQDLFRAIETGVRPQALLASNTSSIPIERIAEALADPSRLIGLHFFNPVAKMQLVEVVRGKGSSEESLERARAFAVGLERLPLDVGSGPGFLVNRVLMPYLIEAVRMVQEGIPLAHIDRAARDFGMPLGPIELADTVGLDICLAVAEELAGPLRLEVPVTLRDMVTRKQLGKKTGEGFYKYDRDGRARVAHARGPVEGVIAERLILRLLNEAMACLRAGVVAGAETVDVGMVYGAGFAPFRGGPMRYARSLGEEALRHSLYRLAEQFGPGFIPDPGWSEPQFWAGHAA